MNLIKRFVTDDTGAETVEYALVLGLLAIAAVVAITTLGGTINTIFTNVNARIAS